MVSKNMKLSMNRRKFSNYQIFKKYENLIFVKFFVKNRRLVLENNFKYIFYSSMIHVWVKKKVHMMVSLRKHDGSSLSRYVPLTAAIDDDGPLRV